MGTRASKAETRIDLSDERGMSAEERQELLRLAEIFRIDTMPQFLRQHPRPVPYLMSDGEVASWSGSHRLGTDKRCVHLWGALSVDDLAHDMREIEPYPKRHKWAFLQDPAAAWSSLAEHGAPAVAVVSLDGRRPDGLFAVARSVEVFSFPENEIAYRIEYTVHCELIFVATRARRQAVGAACRAAIAMVTTDDVGSLLRARRRARPRPKAMLEVVVSGDAHSTGGSRAFQSVYEAVSLEIEMQGADKAKCTAGWSE